LSIVQGPFPVAPHQTLASVTIRNFCSAVRHPPGFSGRLLGAPPAAARRLRSLALFHPRSLCSGSVESARRAKGWLQRGEDVWTLGQRKGTRRVQLNGSARTNTDSESQRGGALPCSGVKPCSGCGGCQWVARIAVTRGVLRVCVCEQCSPLGPGHLSSAHAVWASVR
jgi:hypothetical protein